MADQKPENTRSALAPTTQIENPEHAIEVALKTERYSTEEPTSLGQGIEQYTNADGKTFDDAKIRWKRAFAWQKRVTALLNTQTAPVQEQMARTVQAVVLTQSQAKEGMLNRPRALPRQPASDRGARSVSFSENAVVSTSQSVPGSARRVLPTPALPTRPSRPPGVAHETVRDSIPSPRPPSNSVVMPGSAGAVRTEDEARIRRRIEMARRALKVKKKLHAAKSVASERSQPPV